MANFDLNLISPALVELLLTYRYWFVALGAIVADVPTLLLCGYFIATGQLELIPTLFIIIASRGLFDLVLFCLGKHEKRAGDKIPFLRRFKRRARAFTKRHQESVLMTYHFIQGVKLGTPFILGMGTTRLKYFATLNLVGIAIWAASLILIGAVFGAALL